MPRFTPEQWREIEVARLRLEAIRDKVQPYPPYPSGDTPQIQQQPIFRPRQIDREIDQLKGGFLFLQNKINEHIDTIKKLKPIPTKVLPKGEIIFKGGIIR